MLGLCSGLLIILIILEIFVVRAFRSDSRKDYLVLADMGMRTADMRKIEFVELMIFATCGAAIAGICWGVSYLAGISQIVEIGAYYNMILILGLIVLYYVIANITVKNAIRNIGRV
ncbi:MAG: hypothetical protein ACI4D8_00510 [Wujia sp.]